MALDLKFLNQVLERRAVFDCIMRDQKVPPRFFAHSRRMGAPDHGCCCLLLDSLIRYFTCSLWLTEVMSVCCLNHEVWLINLVLVIVDPQYIFRWL